MVKALSLPRAVGLYTIESPEKLFRNPHSQVTTLSDYVRTSGRGKPKHQYSNFFSVPSVLPRLRIAAKDLWLVFFGWGPYLRTTCDKHADCWALPHLLKMAIWEDLVISSRTQEEVMVRKKSQTRYFVSRSLLSYKW